jgi:hypothetical protein
MVQVVAGFSLTNRWLLYTSLMLTPAQFVSGLGSNSPTNIGFLAYNWYNQYVWYTAAKAKDLHALSLLPVHFNFIYAFTYLGGVSSGNIVMGVFLGFGTAGLIILNNITAWTSWTTDLPEGYDTYQFFFFGWRTLTPGWRTFILLWQISDTLLAVNTVILAFVLAVWAVALLDEGGFTPSLQNNYLAILCGPPVMLVFTWELIMWVELIVSRNGIESETDMIAVWLFVAQAVLMLIPDPWRMALIFVSILWRIGKALASALALTLGFIASTLERIPLAMRMQSTTSNVLPKHDPADASAVIQLEEGAQRNSNVALKQGLEVPAVTQLEGTQQNSSVLPVHGPSELSPVVQLEEAQQKSNGAPIHGLEAPAVTQLEGARQNSNVLPEHGPSEASTVT